MNSRSYLSLLLTILTIQFTVAQVPLFNEPFDTQIPPNWQTYDQDGNNVHSFFANQGMFINAWEFQTFSGQFGPAAYSIALYQPTGQADDWLISPSILIGDNSRLRFEMIQEVIYDSIEVLVSTSIAGVVPAPSDFNITIYKGSVQPYLWSEIEVDLSSIPAGNIYIAFRNISSNGQLMGIRNMEVVNIIPRDVAVQGVPDPAPSGCKYGISEQIGIEIEIVGSQAIGEFTFNYSVNGGPAVSEQILLFVPLLPGTKFTYPFSNLADLSSGYEQHIKVWSDVFLDTNYVNDTAEIILYSFTPHDLNQSAYEIGFENVPSDSSQFAWTFADGDSDQIVAMISDSAAHTGTQSVLLQGWGDWVISPCLELDATKTYEVEFWAREIFPAALPNIISVHLGTSNDPSSMNTVLLPQTWVIDTFGTFIWTKYSILFQPPATGVRHIGIQHSLGLGVFIDDFSVELISPPSCPAPIGLTTDVLNASTVLLSWLPVSQAQSYIIQGKKAGDPTYISIPVSATSLTVTNLLSAATYEWQVGSVCNSSTSFSPTQIFNIGDTLFCASPISLLATQVTQTSALLSWAHSANAQIYQVLGRPLNSPGIASILVPASNNSLFVSNLSPGTQYEWTVVGICDTVNNVTSVIVTVTTFVTSPFTAEKEASIRPVPEIRISPNPSDGRFEIFGPGVEEMIRIELFDQMGRMIELRSSISKHRNHHVDVSRSAAGIYNLQISSEEWMVVKRVVVR